MATVLILRGLTGELRGRQYSVTAPGQIVLGRSRTCELRLPADGTVSRRHCLVDVEDDGAFVTDLGSLNGTFVNGSRIGAAAPSEHDAQTAVIAERTRLQDGDELRVCNILFAVVLPQRPSDVPPVTAWAANLGRDARLALHV